MSDGRKTVFITGCSSGIGEHLALEFKARGFHVFATARKAESLSTLSSKGIEALSLTVDEPESVKACYEDLCSRLGPSKGLDYLVNNAGRNYTFPATDVDLTEIANTFNTNLFGLVNINKTFLPLLLQSKGTIVNIGSVAGIFPYVWGSIYNASKAALHHYANTLRLELAPYDVHVVTVVTGGVISSIARTKRTLPADSIMQPFAEQYNKRVTHSQQVGMDTAAYAQQVVSGVLNARGWLWNSNEVWAGAKWKVVWWGQLIDLITPGGIWGKLVPKMFGLNRKVGLDELPQGKKRV